MDSDTEPSSEPFTSIALCGDYEYLTEGYYASLEADDLLDPILPSPADALDAYVVPIALERVRMAGLPVPDWYLTNRAFEPPALLYGVNPFARNHLHVTSPEQCAGAARAISRQGKFVFCCQRLPADAAVVTFEQVFDRCPDARYAGWAHDLFRLFHLPLARVRLIVTPEQDYFSAIERLPRQELSRPAHLLLDAWLQEQNHYRG